MNNKPKLSVIMSTYNRKEYLGESIESILNQTFSDFEFILVNNGSTDGSHILCEKYAKEDARVKLIHLVENHGAPNGRNTGIDASTCEYITFVDDDDYCEPEMLEFLWGLLNEYQADISICGSWNRYQDRLEPYFIYDERLILNRVESLDELLKREKYNVAPPTKLFRKSLFTGVRFKKNVLVDDIHIVYKLFARANIVVAQGEPLYKFRKHEGNMTSFIQTNQITSQLLNEYLSAFRERTEYLSKEVPEITPRARYSEWSYMISMCDKIHQYGLEECRPLYDKMVATLRANYYEIMNSPFVTEREQDILKDIFNEFP